MRKTDNKYNGRIAFPENPNFLLGIGLMIRVFEFRPKIGMRSGNAYDKL